MKTSLPAAWTDAHKQKTWRWDGRWKRDERLHVNDPPWNFHFKNATTRVVAKNVFFNAKTDDFSTWLTRSPHFLQRFPRSWFFRESILRGNRQALWICDLLKLLLCAGHRLYRRMSQTSLNIDNTCQLIFQQGHSSGTPDYCTFMRVWKQSVWKSYGVIPLGIFPG